MEKSQELDFFFLLDCTLVITVSPKLEKSYSKIISYKKKKQEKKTKQETSWLRDENQSIYLKNN